MVFSKFIFIFFFCSSLCLSPSLACPTLWIDDFPQQCALIPFSLSLGYLLLVFVLWLPWSTIKYLIVWSVYFMLIIIILITYKNSILLSPPSPHFMVLMSQGTVDPWTTYELGHWPPQLKTHVKLLTLSKLSTLSFLLTRSFTNNRKN